MFFEECHITIEGQDEIIKNHWLVKSYDDGYICGLFWPDAWEARGEPGGPWVNPDNPNSKRVNELWCKGWDDGHKEKLKRNYSISVQAHTRLMDIDIDRVK